MRQGIAFAGTILVDKINEITTYPNSGELTKILSVRKSLGGCVPNTGIDFKKLNPNVDVVAIGRIGNDEEGQFVRDAFIENGLRIDGLKNSINKTSFTDVMSIVGGQRTFFTYPGASAEFGYDDFDWSSLRVKMLHLGYFLLLDKIDNGDGVKILKKAKELGIKTSIDLVTENLNRYGLVLPCLQYVDNLIINETEAGKMTGIEPTQENLPVIAKRLQEKGVKERIIIHSPELGFCYHHEKITILPAYQLPNTYIQGTTGAGDAFCAGALLGIYEELSDKDILRYAIFAATASLGSVDATSNMKPIKEIEKTLENFKRKGVLC